MHINLYFGVTALNDVQISSINLIEQCIMFSMTMRPIFPLFRGVCINIEIVNLLQSQICQAYFCARFSLIDEMRNRAKTSFSKSYLYLLKQL